MPLYRTAVGPDGVVKLPAALREKLRIKEGSEVEFFLTIDGDVFFHAITGRAKDRQGVFNVEARSPPVSITEMDAAIAEEVTQDDIRILRQNRPIGDRPTGLRAPDGRRFTIEGSL
jgi:AbrB family looped-hinge helix DNA binding protein